MKVTYFQNADGGCDYYRAIIPMETAKLHKALDTKKIFSDTMIGFYHTNRPKFDEMMKCDVYLTQRVGSVSFIKTLRSYIKDYGSDAKIIMDYDDNVFNVSPLSNHYVDYGTQDVRLKLPDGSEHWAWRDGINLDIARNQKTMDEIKRNLESVDMITTTTDILADVFRTYNPNVRVLPNCLDLKVWNKISLKRENDEIRIYWGGGQSHWEDFFLLREPLREIFNKYKNAKMVIMGWVPPGFSEDFGKERVEFHEWVDTVAYPYKMQTMDVDFGIIPLRDTVFNICKSSIKWVEMASLEIPAVSSFVSPYKEMAVLSDHDNGIYIEDNDPTAWVDGISFMIENLTERKKMGKEARKVVERYFDINTQYQQWVNAYQEAKCLSLAPQH